MPTSFTVVPVRDGRKAAPGGEQDGVLGEEGVASGETTRVPMEELQRRGGSLLSLHLHQPSGVHLVREPGGLLALRGRVVHAVVSGSVCRPLLVELQLLLHAG